MSRPNQKKKKRTVPPSASAHKKKTYNTPGRNCEHATRGMCPRCIAGAHPEARMRYEPFRDALAAR